MNDSLRQALNRTLLLMRDELIESVNDEALLDALTGTNVVLTADEVTLQSHSAQCAYVTAAILMARSGHKVHLRAPDVQKTGPQPPLRDGNLISSLMALGNQLLPGVEFTTEIPKFVDIEIILGKAASSTTATRQIYIRATKWSAYLSYKNAQDWELTEWPLGGVTAGTLAAVEAFKTAMWKLRSFAKNSSSFDERIAAVVDVVYELAPSNTPTTNNLGKFDFISAGAITNCTFFVLGRILGVNGIARILDDDCLDLSNSNRNALVTLPIVGQIKKVDALARIDLGDLVVAPIAERYSGDKTPGIDQLASYVLVGVDDIPTRWAVQRQMPKWLGIGATTHWSAMASYHTKDLACAGCLHPSSDDDNGPIPTVAFVSFWAGILLSTYFIRTIANDSIPDENQQTYLTAFRPEMPWLSPITKRIDCPVRKHK